MSFGTTPTALHPVAQGWRNAPTLGQRANESTTPMGLRPFPSPEGHNPVGVENNFASRSQGSSSLATLGWMTESRWDSPFANIAMTFTHHERRTPERGSMTRSTPNTAPALRLQKPRSEFPGSARALACCVARPRATPERTNIFRTPGFSNASRRPARVRIGTREGACAPPEVAERLHDGSRGLQPTVTNTGGARRVATLETCVATTAINRRYATNVRCNIRPWAEAHGYLHFLARRGECAIASTPSPRSHSETNS
jgi:hypothetical protein